MKAWRIFRHSYLQLAGNIRIAVAISGPLLAGTALIGAILIAPFFFSSPEELEQRLRDGEMASFFARTLTFNVVFAIVCLWIAVNWHRYVLMGEIPTRIPSLPGKRMAAYLGNGIVLSLMLALPLIIAFFISAAVISSVGTLRPAAFLIIMVPVLIGFASVYLRLATILPGVAIGATTTFTSGWNATKGEAMTFLVLSLFLVVLGAAVDLVHFALQMVAGYAALIWYIPAQWLLGMLGLSVLTTLYGYYIENRPLAGDDQPPA